MIDGGEIVRTAHLTRATAVHPEVVSGWLQSFGHSLLRRLAIIIPPPPGSMLQEVPLASITQQGSPWSINSPRMNLARERLARGDVDPVVLRLHPDGRYSAIDGYHRVYVAREAGITHIWGWVSPAEPETP